MQQAPCKTLIDALYSDVESAKPTKPDESGVLGYQKTAKVRPALWCANLCNNAVARLCTLLSEVTAGSVRDT